MSRRLAILLLKALEEIRLHPTAENFGEILDNRESETKARRLGQSFQIGRMLSPCSSFTGPTTNTSITFER